MKVSTPSRPNFPKPKAYENTDGRPSWSPDGSKVAVELGRDVAVLNREGEVLNKIGPEGKWVNSPDWSPKGDRITYAAYTRHRDYPDTSWGIYTSKPDGSDPQLVTPDGWDPEYSPDGEKIAFQLVKSRSDDRISIIDPDGKNLKIVSGEGYLQNDLSWSPDGHQIAYDTNHDGFYHTRVTDITGKKDRFLTDSDGGRAKDKNPEWAPEGNTIVFERHHSRFSVNGLWTVDAQTGKEKELIGMTGRHLDPTWSPDGKKIAFSSRRDGGRDLDIYVMNADGTNIKQISDLPGDEHAPAFSPDGKALAFHRLDFNAPADKRNTAHVVELD